MKPDLDEIEARFNAIDDKASFIISGDEEDGVNDALVEFLSKSVKDIPALLDYCRGLEAELEVAPDPPAPATPSWGRIP